uniref:Expansin-like EG45 domain-containing protein n=1 Tax=Opuntia streptacantha TaxID=393608 RepID=A0A7C8ZJ82_OPUST
MAASQGMIILAIFACLASVAFCILGTATYYDIYFPSACYGYEDHGRMIAAASPDIFQNRAACGRMYIVRCVNSPACRAGSVTVQVVDLCPGCPRNAFDLSLEAFSIIADPAAGRIPIDYNQA